MTETQWNSRSGRRPGRRRLALALACTGFLLGCGGSGDFELAPVSGVVTLDGNPVPQADVVFQPIGDKDHPIPGPSSNGKADAAGRFELRTIKDEAGAVVGNHRVLISSPRPAQDPSNDSGLTQPPFKDPIPAQYNTATTLTFEVPADGTTAADFPLKSKP